MQQISLDRTHLISINSSFPPLILPIHKFKFKTHFQNPIISAKWGRKRSGSQTSRKLIFNSMAYIASTLKILPEPWDSLVKELWVVGGGNGGKFGSKNYFAGGGGGEGRNRKREKLGFWVILLISSSLALWALLEREKGSDLGFWVFLVFVFAFGVYLLVKGWRREIKDWILGFSCGAAIMGLNWRYNEVLLKWVDCFLANSSKYLVNSKKKRRKGRRWI